MVKSELPSQHRVLSDLANLSNEYGDNGECNKNDIDLIIKNANSAFSEIEVSCDHHLYTIKLISHDYKRFQENIEELMEWLRLKEDYLKRPLHDLTADDLEKELRTLQVYDTNATILEIQITVENIHICN